MTPFEYILPLVSVLVGLALADVAVSLHRLIRKRRSIVWDWFPLATALLAVLALLETWWVFFASREEAYFTTLGGFLPIVVQFFLLFLLAAAALPDELVGTKTDLRSFYQSNSSYFWSVYAAYVGFILLFRLIEFIGSGIPDGMSPLGALVGLLPSVMLLGVFITLANVHRRTLHAIAIVLLIVLFLVEWSGLSLTA